MYGILPCVKQARPTYATAEYDFAAGRWTWSEEMHRVVGLAPDGRDPDALLFERMHPDDREEIIALIERAIETHGMLSGQYRVQDDRGRERVIAFFGDVRPGPGGGLRLEGVAFDVSREARRSSADAVTAATADRAGIEQAKGALMLAWGFDADQAFGLLKRISQTHNIRLVVLAARIVEGLAGAGGEVAQQSMLGVLDLAVRQSRDEADTG